MDSLKPEADPFVLRSFNLNTSVEGLEIDLKAEGFRVVYDTTGTQTYLHDERRMCVDRNVGHGWLAVRGRELEGVVKLHNTLKAKYGQEVLRTNPLKLLVEEKCSYSLTNLSTPAEELEVGNYMPKVIQKFEYLSKQLVAKKPKGRIAVLSGYPGTGKTYLLRALLNRYSEDTDFVLINTDQCINLSQKLHKFMEMLASRSGADKNRKLVLILEDADSAIAPRSANNLSAIQSILNFGDGLMGEALDIRLLVTTNVRTVSIDPAILRPGRLIVHIDVVSLDASQANAVYKRLSGREGKYKNAVSVAQVYQDVGLLEEPQEELAAE